VGAHAEVLDGLTGVLGATEQQGVAASGGTQSELVEGQGLTTSGDNAGTGGGGEAQSSDAQLGDLEETVVVGDGTNNDNGLALGTLGLADNAGDRDGGAVDARHEQAAQDDLVERRVGTAWIEKFSLVPIISNMTTPIVRSLGVSGRESTYGPGSGRASPGA
jgi:hypothetical protein